MAHVVSGYTHDLGWAGSGDKRECRLIKSKERGTGASGAAIGDLYLSRMPRQEGGKAAPESRKDLVLGSCFSASSNEWEALTANP